MVRVGTKWYGVVRSGTWWYGVVRCCSRWYVVIRSGADVGGGSGSYGMRWYSTDGTVWNGAARDGTG